jgi:hypothetical protein
VPIERCRSSGHARQNEGDNGADTILKRPPAQSTKVTLDQERRKNTRRSAAATRKPYPDPHFDCAPFDQAVHTMSVVEVAIARGGARRPNADRRR